MFLICYFNPMIKSIFNSLFCSMLILLLVFHSAGHFIVFKVLEYKTKKEIKTRIKLGVSEDELVLLKIPKSMEEKPNKYFQRIHEKEFRYKGEMYDIVKKENKTDTTYYYCIHDVKESKLFANLDTLIKNELNSPEKKKELSGLIQILNGNYFKTDIEIAIKPFISERIFENYSPALILIKNSPLTPPPKFYT